MPEAKAFTALASPRLQALIQRLQAQAHSPRPTAPEWPGVFMGGARVGVARLEVARFIAQRFVRARLTSDALVFDDEALSAEQRSEFLAEVSASLRDAGLTYAWRDELLEIRAGFGHPVLGVIERAVCRSLGITTLAVHMNAFDVEDRLVVAQRSPTKAIDPGLWDNLVGGMVPAGESPEAALAREAWEEAGLAPSDFVAERGARFLVEREVPEGWMSEAIQSFDARLAVGVQPANQDGEVATIEAREPAAVVAAIEAHEFTLEASLTTLASLAARAGLPRHRYFR